MIWYWQDDPEMLQPIALYRAYAEILAEAIEAWLDETI